MNRPLPLVVENDELRELLITTHSHLLQLLTLSRMIREGKVPQDTIPELLCNLGVDLGKTVQSVVSSVEMGNAIEELEILKRYSGGNPCLH